ncbi:fimbrial protein [Pantoea ananatis]|uniref:fimbrial protein n=1 Tax=Pantoea ananas TaxID=553 RepID=UPI0032EEDB53
MKKLLLIIFIMFVGINPAVHAYEKASSCEIAVPAMTVNLKNQSSFSAGIDLSGWNSASCGQSHWLGTWQYGWYDTRNISSTGISYNDGSGNHTIYRTSIDGIGIVLKARMVPNVISGASSYGMLPIASSDTKLTSTSVLGIGYVQTSLQYKFVTTGEPVAPNVYNFTLSMGNAQMKDLLSPAYPVPVNANVSAFVINNKGCEILTRSLIANMGIVGSQQLPVVGSVYTGEPVTVSLQCDDNVAVEAIFSDLTDLTNTTTILNLTGQSDAQGVGVELLLNNTTTPVQFSYPARYTGAPGRNLLKTASESRHLSFQITPRYIRTGNLTPGVANATAALTFVYN